MAKRIVITCDRCGKIVYNKTCAMDIDSQLLRIGVNEEILPFNVINNKCVCEDCTDPWHFINGPEDLPEENENERLLVKVIYSTGAPIPKIARFHDQRWFDEYDHLLDGMITKWMHIPPESVDLL